MRDAVVALEPDLPGERARCAVLSIGTALYLVNVVVTRQAEAELEESLVEAGELVTQFQSLFFTALAARGAHRRRPAAS